MAGHEMRMAGDEFTSTRRVDSILSNDIVTEDSAALQFVELHGKDLRYWIQFLNETTGNDLELIRFLQQWCGYGLTGMRIGFGPLVPAPRRSGVALERVMQPVSLPVAG